MNISKYFKYKNYKYYFSDTCKIRRIIAGFSKTTSQRSKSRYIRLLNKRLIYIGVHTQIKGEIIFPHPHNIQIGDGAIIGDHVTIFHNVTIGQKDGKYPIIGENVIIYPSACLFGDIEIGDNAVIGAGAIVNKSVPRMAIVAGNPARIIGLKGKMNGQG